MEGYKPQDFSFFHRRGEKLVQRIIMKRLFDIVASGCGLLVLSPVLLVVAIWIKLDSRGPVFYRQVRVGYKNRDFRIFKFRSMRVGADKG